MYVVILRRKHIEMRVRLNSEHAVTALIKMKIKFSSYIRKFRRKSNMTNGLLI
jgi:hypothetical protein